MGFILTSGGKVTSTEQRLTRQRDVAPSRRSNRQETSSNRTGVETTKKTLGKKLQREGGYQLISFPEGVTDASSENWVTSDLRRKWASHEYVRIDDGSANKGSVNSEEADRRNKTTENWKLKIGSHIGQMLYGSMYPTLIHHPLS